MPGEIVVGHKRTYINVKECLCHDEHVNMLLPFGSKNERETLITTTGWQGSLSRRCL